ncbi:MAG: flagellin, partial [Pseudomonadota bacterium]
NKTITLTTGNISKSGVTGSGTTVDLSSESNAAAFQTALGNALGLGNASSSLTFQVGSSVTDTVGVSLGSAKTADLYAGQVLDVKSQEAAFTASSVLGNAVNTITALPATVGALEERFSFASNALQSTIQNSGAAKSSLLDTDVASTSTAFATAQVQLQAGIAVLAQANQLQQNLLKLIG